MKKIIFILAVTILTTTAAIAAEGKVKSVANGLVIVEFTDDVNLRKGGGVKLNGKTGKVTAIEKNAVTIKSSRAANLKAGDTVTVEKAVASTQGC